MLQLFYKYPVETTFLRFIGNSMRRFGNIAFREADSSIRHVTVVFAALSNNVNRNQEQVTDIINLKNS